MFFLKLKRTLKTRVLQHLDPWFCEALWNKGPKRKRSKKGKKKEVRVKLWGGVFLGWVHPYLAIFLFPIGDKWKIQEKEAHDNAMHLY
jgi:hypothetical protein